MKKTEKEIQEEYERVYKEDYLKIRKRVKIIARIKLTFAIILLLIIIGFVIFLIT